MRRVKGVVMRTSEGKTVVYTKEGDFLEIPTPADLPPVGQVIVVDMPSQKPSIKLFLMKYAAVAAVLILVTLLGVVNPLFGPGAAVASVALDINYGIELLVNKEGKVIEARDVSGGSDYLVDGPGLKGRDIYNAVVLILDDAGKKGVLQKEKDENLVLVSVVPLSKEGVNVVDEARLRSVVREEMISKNIYGVLMVGQADEETKRRAENLGMSVNNYMVYERCQEDGLNVQAEAFSSGNIRKTLAGANVSLPGLFPDKSVEVRQQDCSSWIGQGGKTGNSTERTDSLNMEQQGYDQKNSGQWDMPGGNTTNNWGGQDCEPAGGSSAPAQPSSGAPTPTQSPGAAVPKQEGPKGSVIPGQPGATETWHSEREEQAKPSDSWWSQWNIRKKMTGTEGMWNSESRH
ncbi:MAG: anti-sigma factor domain-containing protein [Firmicutes bacterium]|nr:anti-sigma factor domain-containing protein [Bacillota bacterium]MCL5781701.1 anti-sigma factor domain-containing protein [Bacillota bacterium]